MKSGILKFILSFLLLSNLISCKKDQKSIGDYLPLKIGQKYSYYYDGVFSYRATNELYSKKGECQWEFVNLTQGITNVYDVKMIFNGIVVHSRYHNPDFIEIIDSTIINNELSAITFEEEKDGKVKITFPVMTIGSAERIVERFLNSSQIDTCIDRDLCLKLNIGIQYLAFETIHNNTYRTSYTLKKGPY